MIKSIRNSFSATNRKLAGNETAGRLADDETVGTPADDDTVGTPADDETVGTLSDDETVGTLSEDDTVGTLKDDDTAGWLADNETAGDSWALNDPLNSAAPMRKTTNVHQTVALIFRLPTADAVSITVDTPLPYKCH